MSYRTLIGVSPFYSTPSLGPFRTELYTYALARKYEGKVYLKCDDTNPSSQNTEYYYSHIDILKQSGCVFSKKEVSYNKNDIIFQSRNKELYRWYLSKLQVDGLTSEKNGLISLNVQALAKYLGSRTLVVNDILKGKISFDVARSGYSFVPLYSIEADRFFFHLATVVDEGVMEINLIMRGEDKISLAPIHDLIRLYFKFIMPNYLHLPLLMDANTGKRLRGPEYLLKNMLKDFSLQALTVYALNSGYLYDKQEKTIGLDEFIHIFDYRKIKKRSGNFYFSELEKIAQSI